MKLTADVARTSLAAGYADKRRWDTKLIDLWLIGLLSLAHAGGLGLSGSPGFNLWGFFVHNNKLL